MQLYRTTDGVRWRVEAGNLADEMIDKLWDSNGGAFFQAAPDVDDLLLRIKDTYDGAVPSGNSLAATALTALAASGLDRYAPYAADTYRAYATLLQRQPRALTEMVRGLVAYHEAALPLSAQVKSQPIALPTTAGLVSVSPRLTGAPGQQRRLLVDLTVKPSWHVNANPASLEFLIPTEVVASSDDGAVSLDIEYPRGREIDAGLGSPIRIYEGTVTLPATIGPDAAVPTKITVRAQACNDTGRCLPPAEIESPIAGANKP